MAGADGSDVAAVLSSSVAAASSAVKDARAAPSNDPAVEASSEPASQGFVKPEPAALPAAEPAALPAAESAAAAPASVRAYAEALTNLGECLYHGEGVPQDRVTAARLYRRASELNFPAALVNLAELHGSGEGGVAAADNDHVVLAQDRSP